MSCVERSLEQRLVKTFLSGFMMQNSFHAITLESFAIMCESIGRFGPDFKPPSMYELRVPLLKKQVEETKKAILEHKKEWAHKGCSILSDG